MIKRPLTVLSYERNMLEINLKPGATRMNATPKKFKNAQTKKLEIFFGVWGGVIMVVSLLVMYPMAFSYLILGLCGVGSIWASWHIISGIVDN